MAKQQDFIIHQIHQSIRTISKLNKYCMNLFGMNLEEKSKQNQKKFIDKCWEQIKEAEKIMGKDYLDIKEGDNERTTSRMDKS